MRFDREDLTVNSKAANTVTRAKPKCVEHSLRVGEAERRQFDQGIPTFHSTDRFNRRIPKLDGLIGKRAAQAETNHW